MSLLLRNGGGAAAGVSHGRAGDLFCLWKYRNCSDQGTRGEIFYLCIAAKANENVRLVLVAEASIEAFTKDFSLQSEEERASSTAFCCNSCLAKGVKRLDP